MIIRQEKEEDYNQIREVVKKAFKNAEYTDGNEYNLVDKSRQSSGFVKELTLVAEKNDKIIGHIMFTTLKVGEHTGLALAPLSVLPSEQGKRVGTSLIEKAHQLAEAQGYKFSIVLGSEKYYPRFGYVKADEFEISAPFDVPSENYMVKFFTENCKHINGTVEYVTEML